ncbi:uncharacterized protein LOC127278158 isoform X2 [Leptopilina boulardi]|uniref:uncharacterized protein LOC127278158 isoform X2 n=1 Tax=Leptopilina boulardi TaxID=63433 RepID=UPI0021F659C1|nr:uncharacterized protein LOC127278158 isoform X2 [Leptopilina boulardi]
MKFILQNFSESLIIFIWSLLMINWVSSKPVINNKYTIDSEIAKIETLQRKTRHIVPSNTASEVYDLLVAGNEHQTNHGNGNINADKSGLNKEQGFFKTYHSDADRLKDYVNETFNNADHGYRKHDKFNKHNKDNYALKKYATFGRGKDGKKENYLDKKDARLAKQNDHEGSGTSIESHYIGDSESYLDGDDGEYYSGDDSEHYGESEKTRI